MLKRFEVTNYKNFERMIAVDFSKVGGYQFNQDCIIEDVIGKMLIYGRNATGKTNLGKAILDITNIAISYPYMTFPRELFLNADSLEKYAQFKYIFQFDKDEIVYSYKRPEENILLDEKLEINQKLIYYYNFETGENQFKELKLLDAETVETDRFLEAMRHGEMEEEGENQTLPFLRWLINNTALRENSILLKLNNYIKRMGFMTINTGIVYRTQRVMDSFCEMLEEEDNLQDFEDFLNVMGVKCKLKIMMLPEGKRELYFCHNRLMPFYAAASSGTLVLVNLYRRLMTGRDASFLYIDEFDAFYHYEMSEKVVRFFKKKYPKCQIIITTHNTNLMTNKLMRPDCLFILSESGKLTALCDATPRELREGHNLEKMYISGEFEKYE